MVISKRDGGETVHNFMELHRCHDAIATLAVLRVEDANRYGTVDVDVNGRVSGFAERVGRDVYLDW